MTSTIRFITPVAIWAAMWASSVDVRAAVVRGEVIRADGQKVTDVVVGLDPLGESGARVTATSNRAGAFLFAAVRPGRYEVHLESTDLVLVSVRGSAREAEGPGEAWKLDENPGPERPATFEILQGQDAELELMVDDGLRIGEKVLTVDQALDSALERIQGGNCPGATERLQELLAVREDVPKAHYLLAFCRGAGGDAEGALSAVGRVLELRADYPGANLLKAQILAGSGEVDAAEQAFRAEIEYADRPRLARDAWWGLGLLLRDAGRTDASLEAFEMAATVAPGRGEAWIEAAEIRRAAGDLDGAEAALQRGAEAGAPVAKALLNLGVARFNEKQYAEAAGAFRSAAAAANVSVSEAALAHGLLGKSLLAAGNRAEGIESLKRSLEIAPEGEFAAEARKLLEDARR